MAPHRNDYARELYHASAAGMGDVTPDETLRQAHMAERRTPERTPSQASSSSHVVLVCEDLSAIMGGVAFLRTSALQSQCTGAVTGAVDTRTSVVSQSLPHVYGPSTARQRHAGAKSVGRRSLACGCRVSKQNIAQSDASGTVPPSLPSSTAECTSSPPPSPTSARREMEGEMARDLALNLLSPSTARTRPWTRRRWMCPSSRTSPSTTSPTTSS